MAMESLELSIIRQKEFEKRINSSNQALFSISIQNNDHPFFSHFKVKNTANLIYDVNIHSLKSDGKNFCTCKDYKYNHLSMCKHIAWVLNYLKEQSPQAFEWSYQKQPEQTDMLFGIWNNGQPELRLRLSEYSESILSYKKLFFNDDILSDKNLIFSKDWEIFITKLKMSNVKIAFSAQYIISNWKKEKLVDELIDKKVSDKYPDNILIRPLKAHQIKISRDMIRYKQSLTFQKHGTGKRVAALGAAVEIQSFLPNSKIVIITHPYYVLHWRRLIKLFSKLPIKVIGQDTLKYFKSVKTIDSNRIYIASYENLIRDAQQIEKISPDVLILDAMEQIKNWLGKTGQFLKTIDSTFSFVLTSSDPQKRPQMIVNMAQYLIPQKFGSMWEFLSGNAIKNKWGVIEKYENLSAIYEILSEKLIHYDIKEIKPSLMRKPKQTVVFEMNEKQRKIINTSLTELAALVNTNYTWSEKEVNKVLKQIRNLRISLGYLPHITSNPRDITPKLTFLTSLLSDYDLSKNRILIFTHWNNLADTLVKVLKQQNINAFIISENITEKMWKKGTIGIISDQYLDVSFPVPDFFIHYDLPWNNDLLMKRRALVFNNSSKKSVMEFSFLVKGSIEERAMFVLKTLPKIINEWFDDDIEEEHLPNTQIIKSLIRKLVGKREERINSARLRKISKVSVRDRKVVSRKGVQEIEAPLKRRSSKEKMASLISNAFKPVVSDKKDVVWHSRIPVPDIKNDIVFLDIKVIEEDTGEISPVFASIMSLKLNSVFGWNKSDFSVLETILMNNELIIGNSINYDLNKIAEIAFPNNFHKIKFFDFTKLVENIIEEHGVTIEFANIVESTLARKLPWDENEVKRLATSQPMRSNDLLALGKSDLSSLWGILSYVIREGSFYYKLPVGRQKYIMDLSSLLPPQLVTLLKTRSKL